jgi:hypothetical protein
MSVFPKILSNLRIISKKGAGNIQLLHKQGKCHSAFTQLERDILLKNFKKFLFREKLPQEGFLAVGQRRLKWK